MKITTVHLTIPSLIALVVVINVTILAILGALWETQRLWLPEAARQWHHDASVPSLDVGKAAPPSPLGVATSDADLRRQYHELLLITRSLSSRLAARAPAADASSDHLSTSSPRSLPGISARQAGKANKPPTSIPDILSAITGGLTGGLPSLDLGSDLAGTGLFLGVGLGTGAAMGLNLSDENTISASAARAVKSSGKQATGLNPAVQLAAQGAAATLLGSMNTSSLSSGFDIGPAALALGTGIGNGTAIGLGLRPAMPAAAGGAAGGIADAIGLFGLGLSSSVVGSVNVTQLAQSAGGGSAGLAAMLPAAAAGLGKGLGAGIPVGLGIQPEPVMNPAAAATNGQIDPSRVAENFAFGLTSRLLANGTVSKLRSVSGGMGLGLPSVDIGMAAQGLSRGLVQGAGDAVESIGGIEALINGNSRAPVGGLPNSTVAFNDSIGGAAVGLGTGLGGQGVLVARQLLAGMGSASRSTGPRVVRRDSQLASRQVPAPATPGPGFNLSSFINDQTISAALQGVVNALTCEGVGGLFGVLMGLRNSGTIPTSAGGGNGNATGLINRIVPPGTIRFTSNGNSYEIDGQQVVGVVGGGLTAALGGITINGRSGAAFVAFTLIHVLFAALIAFFILPFAIGLESARNIALRLRLPQVLPNAARWCSILWLIVLAPMLVFVFVFGSLLIGTTTHFRSVHAILGVITTLVGYVAVLFHFISMKYLSRSDVEFKSRFLRHARLIRAIVNRLFLLLSVITSLLGFSSLSSVALCLPQVFSFAFSVSFGFGLAGLFVLGATLSAFDAYLGWRCLRKKNQLVEKGGQSSP